MNRFLKRLSGLNELSAEKRLHFVCMYLSLAQGTVAFFRHPGLEKGKMRRKEGLLTANKHPIMPIFKLVLIYP